MSKKERETEIIETNTRGRIRKDLGEKELREIETMILGEVSAQKTIVETKTRERLRKELGDDGLARVEEEMLRDEV